MKKSTDQAKKPLKLTKERLRVLDRNELGHVVGGTFFAVPKTRASGSV